MTPTQDKINAFACLELSPEINRQLEKLGFVTPTPIQAEAIPHALAGRDVVGIAQTGTGKTFAFGLPMIQHLLSSNGAALILAPTRELALQIDEELKKIGAGLGLKTAVLIGGAPMHKQVGDLRRRPNVIVATPGRLKDHLYQRTTHLNHISMVVLDEADRMFDMGFAPAVRQILDQVPSKRQTMLFSATMAKEVSELAAQYLTDPIRVEVAPQGTPSELVEQEVHVVAKENKPDLLSSILYEHRGTVLVFSRTRHGARKVARNVRDMGHSAAELHSDRTLAQRKAALAGFKSGEYRVLVATDIAARGIDVKEIGLVVNYDLPDCIEDYVHRIGRTGRAGSMGKAVSFAQPDQHRDVRDIERLIGKALIVASGNLPPAPVRQARPAKQFATRQALANRPERSNRPERPHRPERNDNQDRPARSERNDRPERQQRPERNWSERPADKTNRSDRSYKAYQPEAKPNPEPAQPETRQRPKPNGTPKKYQQTQSKPRWSKPSGSNAPSNGPKPHRPGIGRDSDVKSDRPAFGRNNFKPKGARPQGQRPPSNGGRRFNSGR